MLAIGDNNLMHYMRWMTNVRFVNGFALYYSPELQNIHRQLFGLDDIDVIRPHWASIPSLSHWDLGALDLAGIKYILSSESSDFTRGTVDAAWPGAFEDLLTEDGWRLWRRMGWQGAFRVGADVDTFDDAMPSHAKVEIRVDDSQRMALAVTTGRAGVLLIPEIWDPYWMATIDGQPTEILKLMDGFRGIKVSRGTHEIEMIYNLTPLLQGSTISGIVAIAMLLASFYARRRDSDSQP
ncbi:MAG: hypothetical protein HN811_00155 [Phycisphaerae bacterium]|nr:hypothetical protein [Phycisphaerae bacterium]